MTGQTSRNEINKIRTETKSTLDWGKGTAGIWTQNLLFTKQALWPTKPQHDFLWQNWCTDTIWQDKQAEIMINKITRETKTTLHWGKGTAGIWTQDLLFTRQALWPTKPQQHFSWQNWCTDTIWQDQLAVIILIISEGREKVRLTGEMALLGFEPRISCLQDRHFDQLSHSTCFELEKWLATLYDWTN